MPSKWNMHFFFCKQTRKVRFNFITVLKNMHLKWGIFERMFEYSWRWLKRAVFGDSAVGLRLPYCSCWFYFVMGEYCTWSGRWSLKRLLSLFLAFGVSTWNPDSNLCRCGISLNVWNVTKLKIANRSVWWFFSLKYSLKNASEFCLYMPYSKQIFMAE